MVLSTVAAPNLTTPPMSVTATSPKISRTDHRLHGPTYKSSCTWYDASLFSNLYCLAPDVLIDGGGIRGLSELLILHEIMKRVQYDSGLPELPRPCEYFDLIGGTSTGG
jgi:hypothetical protein